MKGALWKIQQKCQPRDVGLTGKLLQCLHGEQQKRERAEGTTPDEGYLASDMQARIFMELLLPETAETLLSYDHYNWGEYAAFTRNSYGKGTAFYLGCMTGEELLTSILETVLQAAGVELPQECFPVIVRKGKNDYGKTVRYYLNYSPEKQEVSWQHSEGTELLTGQKIQTGETLALEPWNLRIVEGED